MDERGVAVGIEIEMVGGATGSGNGEFEIVANRGTFGKDDGRAQREVGFGKAEANARGGGAAIGGGG